jgi:thiol-disulfide isomerase/thioredoxin
MRLSFVALLLAFFSHTALAQLPNGSIAPDWTATDLNGTEHNLYALLDSGYQVIIDFSATWCGPCWNYHTSGVLETLHELYGPDGTNELRVFFIEGDDSTTQADLEGTGPATAGNWIAGTNYPIIDNGGDIFDAYECTYFPTIYTICPNKILTQSGQGSVQAHETILNSASCTAASMPNDVLLMDYVGDMSTCGDNPASLAVRMMNQGLDTLTSCTIQISKLLPFNQTEVLGSADWTGSLATYEFTTVSLIDVVLDNSTIYVFDVISEDDNDGNNTTMGSVNSSEESTNNLEIRLKTDMAPIELGWTLTDDLGNVVQEVLPGSEMTQNLTEYLWDVTLPSLGCYKLTLYDAGGDGWIAGATSMAGVGYLMVNSMDGEVVVDEEVFFQSTDAFTTVEFQFEAATVTAVQEEAAAVRAFLHPNPAADLATLTFSTSRGSVGWVDVFHVTGKHVMHCPLGQLAPGNHLQTLDLTRLEAGTYLVQLHAGDHIQSLTLLHP